MNTTSTETFTAADVATLAELIRPHMGAWTGADPLAPLNVECAVALAEAQSRNEFTRRISHLDEFVAVLAGTYDEFRAEVSR